MQYPLYLNDLVDDIIVNCKNNEGVTASDLPHGLSNYDI
jgi:hypothetical protein